MRKQTQCFVHSFASMADLPFSPVDYSHLKFGSDCVAKTFGYELAETFFKEHSEILLSTRCVVIPSPYNYVENAASVMTKHFINRLNHLLANANGNNVEWSLIHRKVSYTNDYGFLSKEKRRALIDNDEFYLNEEFVEGKTLIFIDDVCITGTHEDKLVDILDKNNLKNRTFFLYYAKYAKGAVGADIESQINFAGIQTLEDFVALTKLDNHHMIVRPIKYLLSRPKDELVAHLHLFNSDFLEKVYYGALAEGYHKIPTYQDNFRAIMAELNIK